MTLTSVFDADNVLLRYQQNSCKISLSPTIHPRLIVAFLLFHPNLHFLFTSRCLQSFHTELSVSHLQYDCHAFWNSHTFSSWHTHTLIQHWLVNPVKGSDWLLASDCVSVACVSDQNEDGGQKLTLTVQISVSAYSGFVSCHCLWVCWKTLSLCWQGYGEIRCFFVVVFFITLGKLKKPCSTHCILLYTGEWFVSV